MVAHDNLRFLKELDTAGGLFWKNPKHDFIHPSLTNGVSATTTDEPNFATIVWKSSQEKPTYRFYPYAPSSPPLFSFHSQRALLLLL